MLGHSESLGESAVLGSGLPQPAEKVPESEVLSDQLASFPHAQSSPLRSRCVDPWDDPLEARDAPCTDGVLCPIHSMQSPTCSATSPISGGSPCSFHDNIRFKGAMFGSFPRAFSSSYLVFNHGPGPKPADSVRVWALERRSRRVFRGLNVRNLSGPCSRRNSSPSSVQGTVSVVVIADGVASNAVTIEVR